MKVSKAKAIENREGIVEAAARLYREKGFNGVGVAEITRDAGLTHGGLYRHFESRDALAREACLRAFEWTIALTDNLAQADPEPNSEETSAARLRAMVRSYLSVNHRDHPGEGCPAAALAVDAARADRGMSEAFAQGVELNIQRFMAILHGDDADRRTQTIATLSSMVGALVLARATAAGDPALSQEILTTMRQHLAPGVDAGASPA
jgi:TetR/AcrR family transcriptional repressor of nem operon